MPISTPEIDLTIWQRQQIEDDKFEGPSEDTYFQISGQIEEILKAINCDFETLEKRIVSHRTSKEPLTDALGELVNEWEKTKWMQWD